MGGLAISPQDKPTVNLYPADFVGPLQSNLDFHVKKSCSVSCEKKHQERFMQAHISTTTELTENIGLILDRTLNHTFPQVVLASLFILFAMM